MTAMEEKEVLVQSVSSQHSQQQQQQHLANRYIKTGIIGRGAFGTVYRAIDTEDESNEKREVAIKIMDLESIEDDINNIIQEITALRQCNSEHIPKYFHSFNIGPELWIVMEYMGGGSVADYLDPKEQLGLESENLIAIITREVTKGLSYLHNLKMIHRDIKAANILLNDDGAVKLADFGVVGRLTETIEKRMTMIGSPYWMAPEVIVPEKGQDDGYGTPADIWSLGITAMEMANGLPPNGTQHPFEAMRRIMEGPPPTLEDDDDVENQIWSDKFKDFLSKCLVKDPKKRWKADKLLEHEFFKDCGDLSDLKKELVDAMKEADTYDGEMDIYDDNNDRDEKYDTTSTLSVITDNDVLGASAATSGTYATTASAAAGIAASPTSRDSVALRQSSIQFNKRKSTAAVRAHAKKHKQKSYNMSIEWTWSTQTSFHMLQAQMAAEAADLYDSKSDPNDPNDPNDANNANDDQNDGYDANTMVTSHDAKKYLKDAKDAKETKGVKEMKEMKQVGTETEKIEYVETSSQTETNNISHVVGIEEEIFAICDKMQRELKRKGKDHLLDKLKDKVIELEHLQIGDRRAKSVSEEDQEEAQRRTSLIRTKNQKLNETAAEQQNDKVQSQTSKSKSSRSGRGKGKQKSGQKSSSKKSKT